MTKKPLSDNNNASPLAAATRNLPPPPGQRPHLRSDGSPSASSTQESQGPHVPPSPPPAPDKSSISTDGDKSPPLLSNPDNAGFQVVTAGRRAATRANEFPTAAEPSPPTLGTRFNVLMDQDKHSPRACIKATVPAAYSAQALFKAICASQPEVAALFSQQQSDFNWMVNLI